MMNNITKEVRIKRELFERNDEFHPSLTPFQHKTYVSHINYVIRRMRGDSRQNSKREMRDVNGKSKKYC